MSYHNSSFHPEPLAAFPSGTPDRFAEARYVGELETPMRDGVVLRADLTLPAGVDRAPVILIRQPYGRKTPAMMLDQTAAFWARKGYACMVQDVRGKFSSDGQFEPVVNEMNDGHDTVAWITRQDWCSGQVGMWGESYYGLTSLAAAMSGVPGLACIAPGDIVMDWHKIWFRQGAMFQNTMAPWAISMDAPEYADLSKLDPWHLPLNDMARAAGQGGAYFNSVLAHVTDRAWWERLDLTSSLDRVKIPVLYWSGWYDNFTGGALQDFKRLEAAAGAAHIHLMVGPWDHEGSSEHTTKAICMPLPATGRARWDTYQYFFDRYLMGIANGFGRDGRVRYFTIGADRWQVAKSWPPASMQPTPFYLRGEGQLSETKPNDDAAPDRFTYDPADPVVETVGLNCWAVCGQLGDRRPIEARADVVNYTTPRLEADVELTGPIAMKLYAASDATDTDFTVALSDVFPNGVSNPIQDGIIRASAREDAFDPNPIEPGRIYAYDIDLFATSYLVKAGHRIRVSISSSCFDRYDRNLNTGERFGTGSAMRVAHQEIHRSAAHSSHILLPLKR
ncbi:CocE/NonD family hydrolase [Dongia sp.]|uniref:CocE/NonD family hydrolase n=1 Tax=Dongia sp. TaxID=1977262 RepID=UPI003751B729